MPPVSIKEYSTPESDAKRSRFQKDILLNEAKRAREIDHKHELDHNIV